MSLASSISEGNEDKNWLHWENLSFIFIWCNFEMYIINVLAVLCRYIHVWRLILISLIFMAQVRRRSSLYYLYLCCYICFWKSRVTIRAYHLWACSHPFDTWNWRIPFAWCAEPCPRFLVRSLLPTTWPDWSPTIHSVQRHSSDQSWFPILCCFEWESARVMLEAWLAAVAARAWFLCCPTPRRICWPPKSPCVPMHTHWWWAQSTCMVHKSLRMHQ